jgi:o-succinylbenzoate---CoA ligase
MDLLTPADWVESAAEQRPDAPALVFGDGVVTYGQLTHQVRMRTGTLRSDGMDGAGATTLIGVPVRLDLPSIVEILALPSVGLTPMPYTRGLETPAGAAPGDAVMCIATSGSSGARRLVPLTMDNLAASVEATIERLGTGADDRWLLTLPIDHVGGLGVLFRSFAAGGAVVVAPFGRGVVDLIRRTRPTIASLVPTMVHRMLGWDTEALTSIGTVLVGGGRLPATVAARAVDAGVGLVTTYGSTETSSQVATMAPGQPLHHPGYVGLPLAGFEVGVEQVNADGVGTLTVDGPAVFGGYLGERPRSGPHVTADVGWIADDGSITVLGRADDIAVTGGVNVSLPDVADAIAALDEVDDVAVVAIDDVEWGSLICALVQTALPRTVVAASIADTLHGADNPRRVDVTSAIPMLPNGKHDRAAVVAGFTSV